MANKFSVLGEFVDKISAPLKIIKKEVDDTTKKFDGFSKAIAGVAVGAFIANVLKTSDALVNLSKSTNIALESIIGYSNAMAAAGGNADRARDGISDLTKNIGEAARGSAELQAAFRTAGVSMTDLATLSEQDIFRKTIAGLAQIPDGATRTSTAFKLLGESVKGVDLRSLNDNLDANIRGSGEQAEAARAAAQAQANFTIATQQLQIAVLQAIEPITKLVAALKPEQIREAVDAFSRLAAVLAALYGFGKIVAILEGMKVAATGAAAAIATFGIQVAKTFILPIKILAGLYAAFESLKLIAPETAKKIGDVFTSATEAVKEFFGFKSPTFLDQAEVDRENYLLNERSKALRDNGKAAREVVDPFKSLKDSINDVSRAFADANAKNLANIKAQTDSIGKAREEVEVNKALSDITSRLNEEIKKLEQQKARLTKEQLAGGVGAAIDKQIAQLRKQAEEDSKTTESAIRNSERRKNAYAIEVFARKELIDVEKQIRDIQFEIATATMTEMERRAAQIKRDALERAEAEIKAAEAARGSLLTEEEKQKYYDAAKQKTEELIQAQQRLYDKSRDFSTGWKRALNDYVSEATNAARKAENIFKKATAGMEDLIVNFAKTGKFEWKQFVASMLEELLRAEIQTIFASLLGSMKGQMSGGGGGLFGAIGGGLESVTRGIGSIFGSEKGDGGFWDTISSGIGSLFGGGSGGSGSGKSANDPIYVYDVAGGGGGGVLGGGTQTGGGIWEGLKSTASTVWNGVKSAASSVWEGVKSVGSSVISGLGNAASSVWEGVKNIGSSVWDGVSSVASSIGGMFGGSGGGSSGGGFLDNIVSGIGDFFSGWFANGGTIPAGKFGVVGERGPEFVSGPATVTPMSGGTNVNYYINAVDAMSFKQLLAQDPGFIYGLTLQGSKGVPARR